MNILYTYLTHIPVSNTVIDESQIRLPIEYLILYGY